MPGYQDDDGAIVHARRRRSIAPATSRCSDADGYFTFVGRADDVFKASDYRISPFELESVLIEHRGGRRGRRGALARPDAARRAQGLRHRWRRARRRPANRARRSSAISRDKLSPYKRIRRLEFAELPKTISGKIRRVELRRAEAAQRGENRRGPIEFWEEDFPELR